MERGMWKTGAIFQGHARHTGEVFYEVVRGRQGLVSTGKPWGETVSRRGGVAYAFLPITYYPISVLYIAPSAWLDLIKKN